MNNLLAISYSNKPLISTHQQKFISLKGTATSPMPAAEKKPSILFITSFPPRECGIATYSQDLIEALNKKFNQSFSFKICALESSNEKHVYNEHLAYTLDTDKPNSFIRLAKSINENDEIDMIMIQHEFGFFDKKEDKFQYFLNALRKPIVLVFHTVLPQPGLALRTVTRKIANAVTSIIVMTKSAANILIKEYEILKDKITVIPHGTHLVHHSNKIVLKEKKNLTGKKILSTFGLLSSGKNIESTLDALPAIIKIHPDVLFLIIGKTHPSVLKQEGEKYRNFLKTKVETLGLQQQVQFINHFLPLPELLEYLQLSDLYLFTSNDHNQAVSGTFSYAISCGCPVISTPIPHALEVLQNEAGIIIGFENPVQLGDAVINLLNDDDLRNKISFNSLQKMASTSWENAAIAHANLFRRMDINHSSLKFSLPAVNLNHTKAITTPFGMIQFAKINHADIESGYTLDDNARAMIAMCKYYKLTKDNDTIPYITIYLNFIKFCLQDNGRFLNYVDEHKQFTEQNFQTNLEDANGRAIWALGYLVSMKNLLPAILVDEAELILNTAVHNMNQIHSTRAMAFIIKGLYYSGQKSFSVHHQLFITELANRLVQMYRHEATEDWKWYENYLTYANSLLPEAMLCAWLATGNVIYKDIAQSSFDFLLSKTYRGNRINVISNKTWLYKGITYVHSDKGGEQPIDVAYTILALSKFQDAFPFKGYKKKMEIAFNWFLGANHLHQIIYNPCTGGCYDGLEENCVNLNQGAESTVSYLMARLTMEKYKNE